MQNRHDALFIVEEHHVAVLAHDFANEIAMAIKSHFVARFKRERYNTLKALLMNFRELCSLQMLAQKHAKHRGRLGVLFLFVGKTETGVRRACIDEKSLSPLKTTHLQNDFVALGLEHTLNTCTKCHGLNFGNHTRKHSCIKCHTLFPLSKNSL